MKRNIYLVLGSAMSFVHFCSTGPLSMHVIPNLKSVSGKSSMVRLGLGEKIGGQNETNQAGLSDNEEFTIWQDALIFTGILQFCFLAGIMGYLLAELGDECRKAKETWSRCTTHDVLSGFGKRGDRRGKRNDSLLQTSGSLTKAVLLFSGCRQYCHLRFLFNFSKLKVYQ